MRYLCHTANFHISTRLGRGVVQMGQCHSFTVFLKAGLPFNITLYFQRVLSTSIFLLHVLFLMGVVVNGRSGAVATTWEFGDHLENVCLYLIVCGLVSTVSVYFLP